MQHEKNVSCVLVIAMETVSSDELSLFENTSRILIGGVSGSGKSYFVSSLLHKVRDKFDRVIVIGSDLENVETLNISRNDSFNPFEEEKSNTTHTLLIFDDVIFDNAIIRLAGNVFTRGRHYGISSIFLTQNIFLSDKYYRAISLNATHVILFRTRDVNQIKYFGKTFLKDTEINPFIVLYKKIVLQKQFGYLCIDFKTRIDKLRFRTNLLLEEGEFVKAFQL